MEKKRPKRRLLKKLKNRYRLLIINETNFQEKSSVSLTPFNVILIVCGGLVLFFFISWGIFTLFPSFRDYTPGYSTNIDGKMKNEVLNKLSAYENKLSLSEKRELALKQIINGEDVTAYDLPYKAEDGKVKGSAAPAESKTPATAAAPVQVPANEHPAEEMSMDAGGSEDVLGHSFLFFNPLRGRITEQFDARTHAAIDIVPDKDQAIKAAMDGTVIFAGWTPDNGFVISLQHSNNWISTYKHNAVLYSKQGSFVKAGETIAMVGNTGELSSGPHLHFELWHNGVAVDPLKYVPF